MTSSSLLHYVFLGPLWDSGFLIRNWIMQIYRRPLSAAKMHTVSTYSLLTGKWTLKDVDVQPAGRRRGFDAPHFSVAVFAGDDDNASYVGRRRRQFEHHFIRSWDGVQPPERRHVPCAVHSATMSAGRHTLYTAQTTCGSAIVRTYSEHRQRSGRWRTLCIVHHVTRFSLCGVVLNRYLLGVARIRPKWVDDAGLCVLDLATNRSMRCLTDIR